MHPFDSQHSLPDHSTSSKGWDDSQRRSLIRALHDSQSALTKALAKVDLLNSQFAVSQQSKDESLKALNASNAILLAEVQQLNSQVVKSESEAKRLAQLSDLSSRELIAVKEELRKERVRFEEELQRVAGRQLEEQRRAEARHKEQLEECERQKERVLRQLEAATEQFEGHMRQFQDQRARMTAEMHSQLRSEETLRREITVLKAQFQSLQERINPRKVSCGCNTDLDFQALSALERGYFLFRQQNEQLARSAEADRAKAKAAFDRAQKLQGWALKLQDGLKVLLNEHAETPLGSIRGYSPNRQRRHSPSCRGFYPEVRKVRNAAGQGLQNDNPTNKR